MKANTGITLLLGGIIILIGFLYLNSSSPANQFGGVQNQHALMATSSTSSLAAVTAQTILATSTCSARIISAPTGALMLTFLDKYVPTGSFGILQPTSTTVVYESGDYGCATIKAYSTAAQLITVANIQ